MYFFINRGNYSNSHRAFVKHIYRAVNKFVNTL